jgi:allantoicase
MFEDELSRVTSATHVRLSIFPDGGVARLRLFGRPS